MKKILFYTIFIFLTLLILLNPEKTMFFALDSMKICYEVIIPSLFPFFVCSGLLVHSGLCNELSKLMKPVMKPFFNINGAGSAAFVLGIISGYPLGAVTACQLYDSSYLSKTETERLLAFCNNSGPLFILASVGISMYHSLKLGILLYVSHILAAITVGIIMRNYKSNSYSPPYIPIDTDQKNIGEIFGIVLANSINSILTVCGSVIFCSIISKLCLEYIPVRGIMHSIILGFMEFVNGMSELSGQNVPIILKLALASWIVGFAGLSVHLQVMAIISKYKLSLKPYIIGKILHGLFSALYTYLFVKLSKPILPTFSNTSIWLSCFTSSIYTTLAVLAVLIIIFGVIIFLFLKESRRLCKIMKKH